MINHTLSIYPRNKQFKSNNIEQLRTMEKTTTQNKKVQQWLEKLEYEIINNINKMNFTVDDLAACMDMSKRQLYRLIYEHLGMTPHQYLKNYRLNYAKELLTTQQVNSVKAAAYSTGFPNIVYFSRQFKARFGYLPSSLLEKM